MALATAPASREAGMLARLATWSDPLSLEICPRRQFDQAAFKTTFSQLSALLTKSSKPRAAWESGNV